MCDHIGYDDDYYLDRGEKKKCQSHVWYELCLYNSCMMMMMMMNRATGYCGQKKYEIFAFHIMCACVFFSSHCYYVNRFNFRLIYLR